METLIAIISMVGGLFFATIVMFLIGANFWMKALGGLFVLLYILFWLVGAVIISIWLTSKFRDL